MKVAPYNQFFCQKHGVKTVADSEWSATTSVDFNEFLGCYDPNSKTLTKSTKPVKTAVDEFRHGIKIGVTHYAFFTDTKYFDTWNKSFIVTANNQGIGNFLEETYVIPSDPDELALFEAKEEALCNSKKCQIQEHHQEADVWMRSIS